MKHAGARALDRLEGLMTEIRARFELKERNRGVFYLKSKAFLHFHEDAKGLFADVRTDTAGDFERIKVDDADGQKALLERIARTIDAKPQVTFS